MPNDNSIEQTWCLDIVADDVFTIDWLLASRGVAGTVYAKTSTFMVDSTKMAGGCDANGVLD